MIVVVRASRLEFVICYSYPNDSIEFRVTDDLCRGPHKCELSLPGYLVEPIAAMDD